MKSYLNQWFLFIFSVQNKMLSCLKRKEVQLLLKGIQAFIFSARIKPLCMVIYVLKYNIRKEQKRLERHQLFFLLNYVIALHYSYSPRQNFIFLFVVTLVLKRFIILYCLLYCKLCYSQGEICHAFFVNDSASPCSFLPINIKSFRN